MTSILLKKKLTDTDGVPAGAWMLCIMCRVGVSGPRCLFEGVAGGGEVLLKRFFILVHVGVCDGPLTSLFS